MVLSQLVDALNNLSGEDVRNILFLLALAAVAIIAMKQMTVNEGVDDDMEASVQELDMTLQEQMAKDNNVLFSEDFEKQLDFSKLDLTMFADIDLNSFFPTQMAAIRDQHYNGSWEEYYNAMKKEERSIEASIVDKCIKFEDLNKKDIGLVGHKLDVMLQLINEYPSPVGAN